MIVTEYGIADLRGKTDAETIAAMLSIADSRFQPGLLAQAKRAGKIEPDYEIPRAHRDNTPERIARVFAGMQAIFPLFPFGTDFTETEQYLLPALARLKAASGSNPKLAAVAWRGFRAKLSAKDHAAIARMGLERPIGPSAKLYALLLKGALN
jgi:hypothetical protein